MNSRNANAQPQQPLELNWDNDAEQWIALVDLGGPGGTCTLDVGDALLEFDRIEVGRLTRVFVGASLDSQAETLVRALLGDIAPNPDDQDEWVAFVDPAVAHSLGAVAKLLAERGTAEFDAGVGNARGFVHAIELAVAARRARHALPNELVTSLADMDRVRNAIDGLARLEGGSAWRPYLLNGLEALLRELNLADATESASNPDSRISGVAVRYENVEQDAVTVECDPDGLSVRLNRPMRTPLLVTGRLGGALVACAAVLGDAGTNVAIPTVFRCSPDDIVVSSPRAFESINAASASGEAAARFEAACDENSATTWERAGEKWIAARSRRRGVEAFRRCTILATTPAERARSAALAECVDAGPVDFFPGLGGFWIAWSSPSLDRFHFGSGDAGAGARANAVRGLSPATASN